MFEEYKEVLKKYAMFSGRATRKEYWMFALYNLIISIIISLVGKLIFGSQTGPILSNIYAVFIFIPALAVGFRRLHDTDRSGWWVLINLIPIIGLIIYIILLAKDSQPGENKYGPNPKQVTAI